MITPARLCVFLAAACCLSCGQKIAPAPQSTDASPSLPTDVVRTQTVPSNPCAWLSPSDAQKILGAQLARAPSRVFSTENPRASEIGEACLYEIPGAGEATKTVSIQLIADESGAMQTAFAGMGNVEKEFRGSAADVTGPWDYVGAMPGGLAALRRGRVSVQLAASPSMSDKGYALATAMLDHMADLPFVTSPDDAAIPAQGPDPCRFLTRAEA